MDILCKKAYYKENRVHPEVVGIKLIVYDDKLKCVLPCISDDSNECNCFTGWDVTPLTDITEVCDTVYTVYNICSTTILFTTLFYRQKRIYDTIKSILSSSLSSLIVVSLVPYCLVALSFKEQTEKEFKTCWKSEKTLLLLYQLMI